MTVVIDHRRVDLEYSDKTVFATTSNQVVSPNRAICPGDIPYKASMSSQLNGVVETTICVRAVDLDRVHGGHHKRQTLTI